MLKPLKQKMVLFSAMIILTMGWERCMRRTKTRLERYSLIKKYLSISGYPHISDDKITISLEMFDSGKWRGEAFIDAPISEMNAEEPEYETVELAKPVRTGWSIGAGLTLWTISVAAVTSLLLLGATKNGDE
jgi:hypothetical protein